MQNYPAETKVPIRPSQPPELPELSYRSYRSYRSILTPPHSVVRGHATASSSTVCEGVEGPGVPSGKRDTIHLRKLGTSSDMLLGRDELVTKRGMLPGHAPLSK
jgi:hypothetical protein